MKQLVIKLMVFIGQILNEKELIKVDSAGGQNSAYGDRAAGDRSYPDTDSIVSSENKSKSKPRSLRCVKTL